MNNLEIVPNKVWDIKKIGEINDFVKEHSLSQSPERKLRNKLLAIQFSLEDYIEKDANEENETLEILDFVKMYIKAFNISKKELANFFDMSDGNLHKYLTGERKLNSELVLKISSFSRTKPEYWYRVQLKNEIAKLKKEQIAAYEKYDFKNLVSV